MQLVSRSKLMSLPNGIVYSKYEPFGDIVGLYKKEDTWSHDWIYQDLIKELGTDSTDFVQTVESIEAGNKFELDLECTMRDGCFDDDQKYIVYDESDIRKLMAELQKSLDTYKAGDDHNGNPAGENTGQSN